MTERQQIPVRKPKTEQDVRDEATRAMAGMTAGIVALGKALTTETAMSRGEHVTTQLEKPSVDSFGKATHRWRYTEGCNVASELERPEVTRIGIRSRMIDGSHVVTMIGRTPEGQKLPPEAGEPGDYLMVLSKNDGRDLTFTYLDDIDLQAELRNNGDRMQLASNPQRERQVLIPGTIEQVSAFVNLDH
jgi:hypothetical protein